MARSAIVHVALLAALAACQLAAASGTSKPPTFVVSVEDGQMEAVSAFQGLERTNLSPLWHVL